MCFIDMCDPFMCVTWLDDTSLIMVRDSLYRHIVREVCNMTRRYVSNNLQHDSFICVPHVYVNAHTHTLTTVYMCDPFISVSLTCVTHSYVSHPHVWPIDEFNMTPWEVSKNLCRLSDIHHPRAGRSHDATHQMPYNVSLVHMTCYTCLIPITRYPWKSMQCILRTHTQYKPHYCHYSHMTCYTCLVPITRCPWNTMQCVIVHTRNTSLITLITLTSHASHASFQSQNIRMGWLRLVGSIKW